MPISKTILTICAKKQTMVASLIASSGWHVSFSVHWLTSWKGLPVHTREVKEEKEDKFNSVTNNGDI